MGARRGGAGRYGGAAGERARWAARRGSGRAAVAAGGPARAVDGPGDRGRRPAAVPRRRRARRHARPRRGRARRVVAGLPAAGAAPAAGGGRARRAAGLHLRPHRSHRRRPDHEPARGAGPRPAVRLPFLLAAGRLAGRLGGLVAGAARRRCPLPAFRAPCHRWPGGALRPGDRHPWTDGARRARGARGGGLGRLDAGAGRQRSRGAGAVRRARHARRGGVGARADRRPARRDHLADGARPRRPGRGRGSGRAAAVARDLGEAHRRAVRRRRHRPLAGARPRRRAGAVVPAVALPPRLDHGAGHDRRPGPGRDHPRRAAAAVLPAPPRCRTPRPCWR